MGLDVITKRVKKATVRERTKKAYTDPDKPKRLFAEPRRCNKCGAYGILKLSHAGQLTKDSTYYAIPWEALNLL